MNYFKLLCTSNTLILKTFSVLLSEQTVNMLCDDLKVQ